MLAFSNDYYGIIFRATQSVELFCAYDKKTVKRINELIKNIDRNGLLSGIGKPEPLKHRKACSRRITDEHRLVYNIDSNQNLIIYSCKYHYED